MKSFALFPSRWCFFSTPTLGKGFAASGVRSPCLPLHQIEYLCSPFHTPIVEESFKTEHTAMKQNTCSQDCLGRMEAHGHRWPGKTWGPGELPSMWWGAVRTPLLSQPGKETKETGLYWVSAPGAVRPSSATNCLSLVANEIKPEIGNKHTFFRQTDAPMLSRYIIFFSSNPFL